MLVREARPVLNPPRPAAAPRAAEPGPVDRVDLSTVPVAHQRELRGAWVASIWNLNFPSRATLPTEQQKQELVTMLDRLQECGFNAVFFQVRPEGDALYASQLEPWSAWLTGTQGRNPGYDPLEYLISEAHARNIEVHAWLNPYRAQAGTAPRVSPHMAVEHPEHVHRYGRQQRWMDPGAEVVRQRLVDVCRDITRRYDIDGLHFDDYFYPYPISGVDFPDQATWRAYQAGGGKLSRADWRRENVNQAIRQTGQAVWEQKEHVRFGVSPFGLPAPDRPEGTSGFDQYHGLYADPQKWMNQGWVDYLAPQLYWPTTQARQPYETLLNWWADHSQGGRDIFAGNDLTALGTSSRWTIDEFKKQVRICRGKAEQGATGNIWYNVDPLLKNRQGIVGVFRDELYQKPALTPPIARTAAREVSPPAVELEGRTARLAHTDGAPLRAWTVYKETITAPGWELDRIVPASQSTVELQPGRWAIAAATRNGNESRGVVVSVT
ncbi:MAG: hypothetical protein AMXMBFR33_63870 [Candidatus Xenobia bacterium]